MQISSAWHERGERICDERGAGMMMSEPWRSTRAHKRHLMRRRTRGHMYCRGTQKRHTTVTQWSPHAAGLSSHGMWRASAPMVPSTLSLECYIARWRKQANIVETTRKQANIVETTCLLGGENPDSARVKRRPVHSNSHHETLSPKVEGPECHQRSSLCPLHSPPKTQPASRHPLLLPPASHHPLLLQSRCRQPRLHAS